MSNIFNRNFWKYKSYNQVHYTASFEYTKPISKEDKERKIKYYRIKEILDENRTKNQ